MFRTPEYTLDILKPFYGRTYEYSNQFGEKQYLESIVNNPIQFDLEFWIIGDQFHAQKVGFR